MSTTKPMVHGGERAQTRARYRKPTARSEKLVQIVYAICTNYSCTRPVDCSECGTLLGCCGGGDE